jgi:signal transduction histidine kinase
MAHLTAVSTNPTCPPSVHAAHDLRNILASIGLHLETLQRLSGPSGAKAADAAYALLTRSVALCNRALDCTTNADNNARRRRVDLVQTARQIADLLAPSAPKEFSFDIGQNSAGCVLADPDDVFRILFNLMNNAVSVARGKANAIKSVTIRVTTEGTVVTMQVSDDGPGLPVYVQSRLFRTHSRRSRPPRRGQPLFRYSRRTGQGLLAVVPRPCDRLRSLMVAQKQPNRENTSMYTCAKISSRARKM